MDSIRRTISIDKTKDEVWSVLGDFQGVGEFHPFITSVDLNTEHNGGLGSNRTCYFNDGSTIREEIVEWNDGESWKIEGSGYSFPFKKLYGIMGVNEVDGKAEAYMAMEFEMKYSILGKIMLEMMMRKMMTKRIDRILSGLEERVLTGARAKRAA